MFINDLWYKYAVKYCGRRVSTTFTGFTIISPT
jgi:hypothetical protein